VRKSLKKKIRSLESLFRGFLKKILLRRFRYGVATDSKIDTILGLFGRIVSLGLFYRALLRKRPIILSILLSRKSLKLESL